MSYPRDTKSLMNLLLTLTVLATSSLAHSTDYLPTTLINENLEYQRCDEFTLRYGFVIKVAEIGWYAVKCEQSPLLETNNKILRFHYFKNVEADFFKQSSEEYFLLNLDTPAEQKELIQPLKAFNNNYTDIQPGQFFQLVHATDNSLSLYRNNDLLGKTNNSILAKNYFNIWFGKKPVIAKLKKAFL